MNTNIQSVFEENETVYEKSGDRLLRIKRSLKIDAFPLEIPFADIFEATEVLVDDDRSAPWKEVDGWEHELLRYDEDDVGCDCRCNPDYVIKQHGTYYQIYISPARVEDWGAYAYYGASKQVQAEARAANLKKTYQQLVDWYTMGWTWWYVRCNYADKLGFKNMGASLGGIEDQDYAEDEARYEVANEVADQLEDRGFEIIGSRESPRRKDLYMRCLKQRINRSEFESRMLDLLPTMRRAASQHPNLREAFLGGKLDLRDYENETEETTRCFLESPT